MQDEQQKTRHAVIDLDLSKQEYLTNPEAKRDEIKEGNHFVRSGVQDPKKLAHGAHPDGDPVRIARDRFSGQYFAQIIEHLPADPEGSRIAEKLHARAAKHKPIHVPGHGYWVPLHELFPDHPHVKLFNGAPRYADAAPAA